MKVARSLPLNLGSTLAKIGRTSSDVKQVGKLLTASMKVKVRTLLSDPVGGVKRMMGLDSNPMTLALPDGLEAS